MSGTPLVRGILKGPRDFCPIFQIRGARLGATFAAVLLVLASPLAVKSAKAGPDACVISGGANNIATCQGNQSAGVRGGVDFNTPPIDTILINNLTQDIVTNGVNAIAFLTNALMQPLTITVDTGAFQITTQNVSEGIRAGTQGASSPISVTAAGTINTTGGDSEGIIYSSLGDDSPLTLNNTASVTTTGAGSDGISLETQGANSSIMATNGGAVSVTSGTGIRLVTTDATSNVTLDNSNNVTATGAGSSAIRVTLNIAGATSTVTNSANLQGGTGGGNGGVSIVGAAGASNTFTNSGTVSAAGGVAVFGGSTNDTVNNSGTLTGSVELGDGDDTVQLRPGSTITGNVLGGNNTDTFSLGGTAGAASFDVANIDTGGNTQQFRSFETFTKEGAANWTLTGANAALATNWIVNGTGTLFANANTPNVAFTVNGGRFGGTGTTGAVTANAGATIAPGNSIGTQMIVGNLDLANSASIEFEFDGTALTADRIVVNGTAMIAGTLTEVLFAGTTANLDGQTFTVLEATGGISGATITALNGLTAASDIAGLDVRYDVVDATTVAGTVIANGEVLRAQFSATVGGVLNIQTVNNTVNAPDNITNVGVNRTVGQQFRLPGGQGVINVQLTDAGGVVVTGSIDGAGVNAANGVPVGALSAGTTPTGVAAPVITTVDFSSVSGSQTIATTTVRRNDGQSNTTTTTVTVTQTPGTVFVGDPQANNCQGVTVQAGQLNCTVTNTTTVTNNFTDVTFTDQVVVTVIAASNLAAILAAFPDIVAALQALPPIELPTASLTPNQKAVAKNFNAIVLLPGFIGSPLQTVFDELSILSDEALAAALDQLHPEPYDALTQAGVGAAARFHDRIRDRLAAMTETGAPVAFDAIAFGPAYADTRETNAVRAANAVAPTAGRVAAVFSSDPPTFAAVKRYGVWMSGAAIHGSRDGGRNNIDSDYATFDLQAGADMLIGDRIIAGIAAGYTFTDFDVDMRATGSVSVVQGGVYGAFVKGPFMLTAGLAAGHANGEIDRRVAFGAIAATPSADPDWWQWSANVEASWRQRFGAATVRPFAGVQAIGWDGYTVSESNGGAVGLRVTRAGDARITAMLGLELSAEIALDGFTLLPSASAAWLHHVDGADRTVSATFLNAPAGAPGFAVRADTDVDELALAIGLGARFANGVRLEAGYDGSFAAGGQSHAGRASILMPF